MTEPDWLACQEPQLMLAFLRVSGKLSKRKARLLAVAACRRVWHLLPDERSRRAVEMAERFADGLASKRAVQAAKEAAESAAAEAEETALAPYLSPGHSLGNAFMGAGQTAASLAAVAANAASEQPYFFSRKAERAAHAGFLRDIFGNPFRPPLALDPTWLAWNDGLIVRMANAVYEERSLPEGTPNPSRLAILADALTDAGCTDAGLIEHLRGPGPHVRGCWAVDLLTGRK